MIETKCYHQVVVGVFGKRSQNAHLGCYFGLSVVGKDKSRDQKSVFHYRNRDFDTCFCFGTEGFAGTADATA